MHFTAEVVLEGIAKAGAKGRCTPMGRAAMSLDLQVTCPFNLTLPIASVPSLFGADFHSANP